MCCACISEAPLLPSHCSVSRAARSRICQQSSGGGGVSGVWPMPGSCGIYKRVK